MGKRQAITNKKLKRIKCGDLTDAEKRIAGIILRTFDLHSQIVKMKDHRRFKCFYTHGVQCTECGVSAVYCAETQKSNRSIHIDAYTADWELMSVDHIIPKSLGGSSEVINLRPMCQRCNSKRGNIMRDADRAFYAERLLMATMFTIDQYEPHIVHQNFSYIP